VLDVKAQIAPQGYVFVQFIHRTKNPAYPNHAGKGNIAEIKQNLLIYEQGKASKHNNILPTIHGFVP